MRIVKIVDGKVVTTSLSEVRMITVFIIDLVLGLIRMYKARSCKFHNWVRVDNSLKCRECGLIYNKFHFKDK